MSNLFEPTLSLSQFKLPPQDIDLLTFCSSNKVAKVKAWAEQLKLTQVKPTSVALYEAIPEITHLKTDAKSRYEMLELLWPAVQQCLMGLAKDFLQQPLVLPEQVQKTAVLAQALQKHLVDGYIICAKDMVQQKKLKPVMQELLTKCLFRATTGLGLLMLRSYQLYTPVPASMWLRLHTLYAVAEYYELQNSKIPITMTESTTAKTLTDAYAQVLMLASVRPNQLSQFDIAAAYGVLEEWAKHIKFYPSATDDPNNLFLVNMNKDSGPVTKNRFADDAQDRVLELDFQSLVSRLKKMSGGFNATPFADQQQSVSIPTEMPATLIEHMFDCWMNPVDRQQDRKHITLEADACIGLIDCHYHICGGISFSEFIQPRTEEEDESFLSGGFNAMVASLSSKKDIAPAHTPKQTMFRLTIQNISAGGYCILWQGDLPNRIEAGELMGIREKGRRAWSIGVVRWIRQLKHSSQLGVQLLSNQPVPYGISVMYDMGGYSDFMRAIHIPAPSIPDQPPSLLTATVPYQEGSKVRLKQDDSNIDVRLTKCVFSTSKLRLFSFDTLSAD